MLGITPPLKYCWKWC